MALPPTLPDPAHVALPDRFLQDHGCLALAPLLTPALTTLDLKGNDIAGPGATALAEALRHTSIRHLSLQWNNLGAGDAGLLTFFETLAECQSLQTLDLRNNQLSPEFAAAIAQMLRATQSLQILDLRWNCLGNQGAKVLLGHGLPHNYSLIQLELAGNGVSEQNLLKVDLFINRNRAKQGLPELRRRRENPELSERLLEHSPGAVSKENRLSREIFRAQMQETSAAQKANVEALMQKTELKRAEAEKQERALKEQEAQLESERERVESLKQTLSGELEEERKERARLVQEANEVRSLMSRSEHDHQRRTQELSLKVERAGQQRRNEQLKLQAIREQREKQGESHQTRVQAVEKVLEEAIVRNNQNALLLQAELAKLRKDGAQELRILREKHQLRVDSEWSHGLSLELGEQLSSAEEARADAERENALLRKQLLEMKLEFEQEARAAEGEAARQAHQVFESGLHQLEAQVSSAQSGRAAALEELTASARKAEERKAGFGETAGARRKEVERLRAEVSQAKKEAEQVALANSELGSEQARVTAAIEKEQAGLHEASGEVESFASSARAQLETVHAEAMSVRKAGDAQYGVLLARARGLEKDVERAERAVRDKKARREQVVEQMVAELDRTVRSTLRL